MPLSNAQKDTLKQFVELDIELPSKEDSLKNEIKQIKKAVTFKMDTENYTNLSRIFHNPEDFEGFSRLNSKDAHVTKAEFRKHMIEVLNDCITDKANEIGKNPIQLGWKLVKLLKNKGISNFQPAMSNMAPEQVLDFNANIESPSLQRVRIEEIRQRIARERRKERVAEEEGGEGKARKMRIKRIAQEEGIGRS